MFSKAPLFFKEKYQGFIISIVCVVIIGSIIVACLQNLEVLTDKFWHGLAVLMFLLIKDSFLKNFISIYNPPGSYYMEGGEI